MTLAIGPVVNRLPEHRPASAELAPYDLVRHALEARIESAKERLFADLDEAQRQLRSFTASAALGIVAALVLRRQQRRLRIVWK
jgi:hypothetical protein